MSIIYNSESKWQRNIVQRCATSCRTILFYPALFQIYTSTMHCVCFVLLWLWPSAFTHSLGVASVWRTMTLDPKYLAFAVSRILHETKQAQRLQNIWSIENLSSHFPIPPLFWWNTDTIPCNTVPLSSGQYLLFCFWICYFCWFLFGQSPFSNITKYAFSRFFLDKSTFTNIQKYFFFKVFLLGAKSCEKYLSLFFENICSLGSMQIERCPVCPLPGLCQCYAVSQLSSYFDIILWNCTFDASHLSRSHILLPLYMDNLWQLEPPIWKS